MQQGAEWGAGEHGGALALEGESPGSRYEGLAETLDKTEARATVTT